MNNKETMIINYWIRLSIMEIEEGIFPVKKHFETPPLVSLQKDV